jgi:hypothetical protein
VISNAFHSAFLIQYGAGYTYLISFFAAAWAILCTGWMHNAQPCDAERIPPHGCGGAPIKLTVQYLILGMFCAGSVMISFGGVLGRISILQLFIMALLEVDARTRTRRARRGGPLELDCGQAKGEAVAAGAWEGGARAEEATGIDPASPRPLPLSLSLSLSLSL